MRTLVALPVYNEETHVASVIERVRQFAQNVLVVDDGSTDSTPNLLGQVAGISVVRHAANRGYGRSLRDAFRFAIVERYDVLITMDCDDQHEPEAIPRFVDCLSLSGVDIISGSRYLTDMTGNDAPPIERQRINRTLTAEINTRLSTRLRATLTDSFCGFKAYRVSSLKRLKPTVDGYAFPMQFWVQAAAAELRVQELPVRLIYNDLTRTFGGTLDDPHARLAHYQRVLRREIRRRATALPRSAWGDLVSCAACAASCRCQTCDRPADDCTCKTAVL